MEKKPSPENPSKRRAFGRCTIAGTLVGCLVFLGASALAECTVCAVDGGGCRCQGWESARMIAWQAYAQGEYVGHERTAHVPQYRLRVDDVLEMVYRLTREETSMPYKLNVGDVVRVESFTDKELARDLIIQSPT